MTVSTGPMAASRKVDTAGALPRISVLMPVFNAERYVEAAVRSVLGQTFRDFELLIIDDGSTDASLSILRRLAAIDSRIRLSSRPNAGIVATLNELLAAASGDLIARMDADDLCRPERFERQCAYLDANPACVALGSRFLFIDSEGWPIFEFMDRFSHDEIEAGLFKPEIAMLHPTVMLRRGAVCALGGYRADFPHVEDLDLFLRLAEVGRLANLPDVLLEYRMHLSNVSHQHTIAQSQAALRAVDEARRRRGLDPGLFSTTPTPSTTSETRAQLHRKWAWWALGAGNVRTARKHATRAMMVEPWSWQNLRVLASALRGSFKARA